MAIEFSEETWASLSPKQRETLSFVEQMTGLTITDAEPPPESGLGRMIAMMNARDAGQITEDEMQAAIGRIMQEKSPEDEDH